MQKKAFQFNLWLFLVGVAAQELVFEVVPDTTSPSVSTHVCRSIVKDIGSKLPCVKANAKSYLVDQSSQNTTILGNTLVYLKSFKESTVEVFNLQTKIVLQSDYSKLNLGGTCPDSDSSKRVDNTFTVSGCIEVLNYQPNFMPLGKV